MHQDSSAISEDTPRCECCPIRRGAPPPSIRYSLPWKNPYVIIWLASTTIIVIVPYIADEYLKEPWEKVGYTEGWADNCEKVRMHRLLRQRANAMSNAVYVSVGIKLILDSVFDVMKTDALRSTFLPATFRTRPEWTFLFGAATIYQGIGSFALHASSGGDELGRQLDFSATYFLVYLFFCSVGYGIVSTVFSLVPRGYTALIDRAVSALFVIGFFIYLPFLYDYDSIIDTQGEHRGNLIMLLAVLIAAITASFFVEMLLLRFAHRVAVNPPFLGACVLCFSGALLMRVPNQFMDGCESWKVSKYSPFQLHSLWHGLTALGLLFFTTYKRSIADSNVFVYQRDMLKRVILYMSFAQIPTLPPIRDVHSGCCGGGAEVEMETSDKTEGDSAGIKAFEIA